MNLNDSSRYDQHSPWGCSHCLCLDTLKLMRNLDEELNPQNSPYQDDRFSMSVLTEWSFVLTDRHSGEDHEVIRDDLMNPEFDLVHWLFVQKSNRFDELIREKPDVQWHTPFEYEYGTDDLDPEDDSGDLFEHPDGSVTSEESDDLPGLVDAETDLDEEEVDSSGDVLEDIAIMVAAAAAGPSRRPSKPVADTNSLHRSAARVKDFDRVLPKPIVVIVHINGEPVCALLDSGSQSDFMSTTLADQLKLKREPLAKPLPVQLAASGSRTKVNYSTTVDLRYQEISEKRSIN
ncbi:hypothetical protein BJ138DRAFT_257217 [Hygrophoropsis aurantiaca]|uniref:Uncharacterized protein n=1 Tax=Hygrophoropsis aurantiaca TaxID=72124 RepID=A0ACB7ZP68_9AGAM|nr:hypothetical protein BJ138DRAFT_257217 [Hygrophoropsis aurantiaca]